MYADTENVYIEKDSEDKGAKDRSIAQRESQRDLVPPFVYQCRYATCPLSSSVKEI